MKAYADTNFLARLYLAQVADELADTLLEKVRHRVVAPLPITWLLQVELTNALELYVFFGKQAAHPRITPEQAAVAHADFQHDLADGLVYARAEVETLKLTRQTETLSRRQTAKHGTRSYDLIHVACALELDCEAFWTFDRRAAALAEREGLKVPQSLKAAIKRLV